MSNLNATKILSIKLETRIVKENFNKKKNVKLEKKKKSKLKTKKKLKKPFFSCNISSHRNYKNHFLRFRSVILDLGQLVKEIKKDSQFWNQQTNKVTFTTKKDNGQNKVIYCVLMHMFSIGKAMVYHIREDCSYILDPIKENYPKGNLKMTQVYLVRSRRNSYITRATDTKSWRDFNQKNKIN